MSTTIDQRVVEMRFDNQHFERNVATSMSTIEKLKQSLNLTGASKGLESVGKSARSIDLSGLGNAADAVAVRFSHMQASIQHQLDKIVDGAVAAGKRIISALTVDPIKTGFAEYETQINAVQTILANTSSKGTTIDHVNAALDQLNSYADKTIYNFTEMTRNIGTFTAAGVDLETSVSAIQGIANVAAVSGSTSQQASTAMYQLSQALAAGTVKLMDWNSVVNAGMGGQVFQDALKDTSRLMAQNAKSLKSMTAEQRKAYQETHNYTDEQMKSMMAYSHDVDGLIKKNGSFRESLQAGWITADVLTMTLNKMTKSGVVDYVVDMTGATRESIIELQKLGDTYGYDSEQVKELAKSIANGDEALAKSVLDTVKMATTAEDAATKVKTFTQLWDTLKEAAQSGWTQSWEILVGDFEEAKEMLTKVSDVIGKMIGDSAQARNELLQGWKDAGGRADLLTGFANAFKGIMNAITPIKEALREIFPPITVDQLLKFTTGFKELTAKFAEFTASHGKEIKTTFLGIFSAVDIGFTLVKQLASGLKTLLGHFTGLGGGILSATASIGDWLSSLRNSVNQSDIFGIAIDKIVKVLGSAIDAVKNFGKSFRDAFAVDGFLKATWNAITQLADKIKDLFAPLTASIIEVFNNSNFMSLLNSGLLAGVLAGAMQFGDKLAAPFEALSGIFESITEKGGILDSITETLDSVRGCFEAYQNNLQAGTLQKIAIAIGILAAAIFVIGSMDSEKLNEALGAVGVLFAELIASLAVFSKLSMGMTGVTKACALMISMGIAIDLLAVAMKTVSSLDWEDIAKGLVAVGALMTELGIFLAVAKLDTKISGASTGILIMSAAMLVLAKAVANFGAMEWNEIGKGLAAIGALLLELAIFTKLTGNATNVIATGTAMVLLAASMKVFASAMKDFATMQWDEIGRSLAAMGGALLELSLALKMSNGNFSGATSLLVASAAMAIVVPIMKSLAEMKWDEIGRSLAAMGLALAELAFALRVMNGTLTGAAALIIAAGALAAISGVMKDLGNLSWGQIGKGLTAIAGAFTVVGVAGVLLGPLVPTLLGLAGAFALFGVAAAAVGVGVLAVSAGFSALATAGAVGATAFVAALAVIVKGIIDLIPEVVKSLGDIILAVCEVISECAPAIAETILTVALEVVSALAQYAPQIVEYLMDFLIGVLEALSARMPELLTAAMKLIGSFFKGIVDAIKSVDTGSLIEGIIGIGLISALMYALSAIVTIIPGAMAGVLGVGVVIAELALVLAAIGALAQIPGLEWLISEGGDLLEKIGTAIGQFIGGIIGGVAKGATSALPDIGKDLSDFMENASPFVEGAKEIDGTVLDGVKKLATVVLTLTAANLLDGITKFITGGSSLTDFGKELAKFGPYFKKYSDSVSGVNSAVVVASANAAKALSEMANGLPNQGGIVSWFTGDNTLASFAEELIPFGQSMKKYSDSVSGVNPAVVLCSAHAAKALAELANNLPNSGGLISWFTGDNDLASFGTNLVSFGKDFAKYANYVSGINSATLVASTVAAQSIVTLQKSLPEKGGWFSDDMSLKDFGSDMSAFGKKISEYYTSISGVNTTHLSSTITQVSRMVSMVKGMSGLDANAATTFTTALKTLAQNGITSFTTAFSAAHDKASNAVTAFVNAAVNGIKNKNSQFNTAGQNMITSLISGIRSKDSGVSSAVVNIVATALTRAKAKNSEFNSTGQTLITNFTSGIRSRESSVSSAISTVLNNALAKVREQGSAFETAGSTFMKKLADGISSNSDSVSSIVGTATQDAVNAARSYHTSFVSAGNYLVQGFADGISASTWRAKAQAKAMANAAYQAAMEELDSHSPSRVFMKVGSYVAEGFAIGIEDNTRYAASAASGMAKSTVDIVRDSVYRIADLINSEMDTQPTIRPVLDLSNVEAGAGRLQALFSRGQAMSISADMNRASSDTSVDGTGTVKTGNTYQFTQINNSPKALSRDEIYRQTKNQFSAMERMVEA